MSDDMFREPINPIDHDWAEAPKLKRRDAALVIFALTVMCWFAVYGLYCLVRLFV